MRKILSTVVLLSLLFSGTAVAQQRIQVTVENVQPSDGFYLAPIWVGVHDGSFDLFDAGAAASSSLELLAEEGSPADIVADFSNAGFSQQAALTNVAGFAGAPVFDPGQSETTSFDVAGNNRFLSFASMIIPSNDSFFANDNPLGIELLDASGLYTGNRVLEFTLADLYDAGTEVNDTFGAPFSVIGGTSTEESGVITESPDLSNFNLTGTPAGTEVDLASASASPVLRITVTAVAVPEPASASVLGLATLGCLLRRRRK